MNKETKYNIAINTNSDKTIFYTGYFDDDTAEEWTEKNFFGFYEERDDKTYMINWDYVVWVSEI